jgi:hypothetical protein
MLDAATEEVLDETTLAYFAWLQSEDGGHCTHCKVIGDGIYAATKPLLFHWTMMIGQIGDKYGYEDRFCFADQELAENALRQWNGEGEPVGWHRHPMSGRRRPNGDPTKEYVAG